VPRVHLRKGSSYHGNDFGRAYLAAPVCPGRWYFTSPDGRRWDVENFSDDLRQANAEAGLSWKCLVRPSSTAATVSVIFMAVVTPVMRTVSVACERGNIVLEDIPGIGIRPVAPWATLSPWLFSITVNSAEFGSTRDQVMAKLLFMIQAPAQRLATAINAEGSDAMSDSGIIAQGIRAAKQASHTRELAASWSQW